MNVPRNLEEPPGFQPNIEALMITYTAYTIVGVPYIVIV